jgi:hypothetical protein
VPVDFTPPAEPFVVEVLAHLCSHTHTHTHEHTHIHTYTYTYTYTTHAKTRTTSEQFHQQNAAPFSPSLPLSRSLSLSGDELSLALALTLALALQPRCFGVRRHCLLFQAHSLRVFSGAMRAQHSADSGSVGRTSLVVHDGHARRKRRGRLEAASAQHRRDARRREGIRLALSTTAAHQQRRPSDPACSSPSPRGIAARLAHHPAARARPTSTRMQAESAPDARSAPSALHHTAPQGGRPEPRCPLPGRHRVPGR